MMDGRHTHTYTAITCVAAGIPHLYHPPTHTHIHTLTESCIMQKDTKETTKTHKPVPPNA